MDVKVETKIVQVKDDSQYRGYLKVGKSTFDWEMAFTIPISRLDNELPNRREEPIQSLFRITMKKSENTIALTDDEYRLFVRMLLMKVVEFYNLPQTRSSNDGMMGATLRGKGWKDGVPGLEMEISGITNSTYTLPDDICVLLNAPKFDCALAA